MRLFNRITENFNRIILQIESRTRHFTYSISKPQLKIHNSKRRLLMLANERGWAFDDLCQQRARYLADSWDVDIKYLQETPSLDPKDYDLMFDCNWNYSHYNNGFAGKYVRGINSHKWERASQRFLSLRRSLNGAVACFVPNRMHLQKISRVFPATCLVREGIDPTVFYWIKDCSGTDLIAGWTGNPNNEYKRLTTVIEPACKAAGVELRLIQAPDRQALNLFYNEVDIVLIGSGPLYEGNPLSLFEAGACGRAVIATNVGAVPETVEDGVSGLIVESTADIHRTITAFVERLNWCKQHLRDVRLMGKRLRERVLLDRVPEKTCEEFRQAIEWAYAHTRIQVTAVQNGAKPHLPQLILKDL